MKPLKADELVNDGERYVSKRVRLSDRSVAIIRETGEGWSFFEKSGTSEEKETKFDTLKDVFDRFSLYTYNE